MSHDEKTTPPLLLHWALFRPPSGGSLSVTPTTPPIIVHAFILFYDAVVLIGQLTEGIWELNEARLPRSGTHDLA